MKFKSVTFTHPRTVFGSTSIGFLSVESNEYTKKVDALEAAGPWLLVTLGDETRAVPAGAVEHAIVLERNPAKGKAA